QVPARDVDAADRAHRDPAAAHDGEAAALRQRVGSPRARVGRLPDRGDVGRDAADQGGGELLVDQRHDGSVVAEVADADLRLAETRQAGVGVDLDQARVEAVV